MRIFIREGGYVTLKKNTYETDFQKPDNDWSIINNRISKWKVSVIK